MSEEKQPEVEEPTSGEVTEQETKETEEPEPKTTAKVEGSLLDSDAFVDKVADRVFDRMKGFTTDLISASQAAQQIAADMVPVEQTAPPPEGGPVEDQQPQQPQPDVQPQRRHGLFAQPFKKKSNT